MYKEVNLNMSSFLYSASIGLHPPFQLTKLLEHGKIRKLHITFVIKYQNT